MASNAVPANKIERAHQMYREARYEEALGFYTEALSMAKTKPQKIGLHSNRAACYLKLQHFDKAAVECTSVLELDQNHTGALMLRAQTLVTLKEYRSALFDVNRLMELNPSSEVYQKLEDRLRSQLSLAPIPESEAELEEEEEEEILEELELGKEQEKEDDEEESNPITSEVKQEQHEEKEVGTTVSLRTVYSTEVNKTTATSDVLGFKIPIKKARCNSEQGKDQTVNAVKSNPTVAVAPQAPQAKGLPEKDPKGWQSIPKPKGHTALDYGRWDRVEGDSSEDDDEDDDEEYDQPQYRFRLKTGGVRSVK